jgi:hypothetical protein
MTGKSGEYPRNISMVSKIPTRAVSPFEALSRSSAHDMFILVPLS